MMHNQLPVLIVVLPLVAGLLMPFLGRGHIPWFFATVTTWSVLGMATALLIQIYEKLAAAGSAQAVISYSMGGVEDPLGDRIPRGPVEYLYVDNDGQGHSHRCLR